MSASTPRSAMGVGSGDSKLRIEDLDVVGETRANEERVDSNIFRHGYQLPDNTAKLMCNLHDFGKPKRLKLLIENFDGKKCDHTRTTADAGDIVLLMI